MDERIPAERLPYCGAPPESDAFELFGYVIHVFHLNFSTVSVRGFIHDVQ